MLHNYFLKPTFIAVAFALQVWVILRWIILKNRNNTQAPISKTREIILSLFFLYMVALISITIVPYPFFRQKIPGVSGINVVPIVNTLKQFTSTLRRDSIPMIDHSLENILGNIFLFVPMGLLLPVLQNRYKKFSRLLLVAFLSSVSIELIQLFSRLFHIYRSVDIDDVILNTTGAAIGFVFFKLLQFDKADKVSIHNANSNPKSLHSIRQ